MPIVADALKNSIDEPHNRDAISALIAAGGGTAIGSASGTTGSVVGGASAAKVDMFNRQLHPAEVMLLKKQTAALAKEANITTAEAEARLANGLAYYVDADWRAVIDAHQNQPDATTLKYLGIALAPLGDRYGLNLSVGDVPLLTDAGKVYTPVETERLLQDFRINHPVEYANSQVNGEYLLGKFDPVAAQQRAFYDKNLFYGASLGEVLKGGASGIALGTGDALHDTAVGIWALGTGLATDFPGTSSQVANGLLGMLAGRWQETGDAERDVQSYLYLLQGNEAGRARIEAKKATELALSLIPAGKIGAAGKAAEIAGGAKGTTVVAADGAAGAATTAKTIPYEPKGSVVLQGDAPVCGPACAAMTITDKTGKSVSLDSVVGSFVNGVRPTGVNTLELSDVISKAGVKNTVNTAMQPEQLNKALRDGASVIVQVPAGQGKHFIIVDSVKTVEGVNYYMTRDPYVGPRGVQQGLLDGAMSTGVNAIVIGK